MAVAFEEVLIATIGIVGSVIAAIATYIFTKRQEIEDIRQQNKTQRYDDLVRNLTQLVANYKIDPKTTQAFVDSFYRAGSYASKDVLDACVGVLGSFVKPPSSIKSVEFRISSLYNAIRRDIADPKKRDFEFRAWHVRPDGSLEV